MYSKGSCTHSVGIAGGHDALMALEMLMMDSGDFLRIFGHSGDWGFPGSLGTCT